MEQIACALVYVAYLVMATSPTRLSFHILLISQQKKRCRAGGSTALRNCWEYRNRCLRLHHLTTD